MLQDFGLLKKSLAISRLPFVFLWAFGYRRRAFRSIFSRSVITSLQKDAASIPNALGVEN